jgi:hypothetical protein
VDYNLKNWPNEATKIGVITDLLLEGIHSCRGFFAQINRFASNIKSKRFASERKRLATIPVVATREAVVFIYFKVDDFETSSNEKSILKWY